MPGKAKPQGILPYVVEVTEQFGQTTARAGLPLVIETMRALGADRSIDAHLRVRQRGGGYTEVEKVE
ncbi:MAG: hypothetical protein FJ104_03285, partial [Deltaproteobacteria bacterium]|nr:hypothetical protein [Deltaproteobacteria bacterium]